ncbi:hypothetical protein D4Z76_09405, partial [Campylobacter coli]
SAPSLKGYTDGKQCIPSPCQSIYLWPSKGFHNGSDGKESACNAGDMDSIPGSGRYPGEGNVFLPEKSHGQGNLADYTPQGLRVGHNRATNTLLTRKYKKSRFPSITHLGIDLVSDIGF